MDDFQKYRCEEVERVKDDEEFAKEHVSDWVAVEKRLALRRRRPITIESMGAFHQNNQLLIGIQVVAFVVSCPSVWLDITLRGKKKAAPKRRFQTHISCYSLEQMASQCSEKGVSMNHISRIV
jgi:thiaminase